MISSTGYYNPTGLHFHDNLPAITTLRIKEGVVKAFSFSLREKARMRGSNKINRSIAIDHLTLTLLCPLGAPARRGDFCDTLQGERELTGQQCIKVIN